jgi:hypothetical protein
MFLSIIATIFLVFSTISMFITSLGSIVPLWGKFIPILAAATLWGCRIIHEITGKTGLAGILLLVFFYTSTFLFTLPSVIYLWIGQSGDAEKYIPPLTLGDAAGSKTIYIIYHPGVSSFTTNIIFRLSAETGKKGFKTVIYCANKNLKIDLRKASAVGFASPVYFQMIRPPIINFISNCDLNGIKTFIVLTCGSPSDKNQKKYLDISETEIIKERAVIIGGEEFSKFEPPLKIKTKIQKLSRKLEGEIR